PPPFPVCRFLSPISIGSSTTTSWVRAEIPLDGFTRCGYEPSPEDRPRARTASDECSIFRRRSMHRELLASICLTALAIGPGVAEEPRPFPGPHPLPLRMPLASGTNSAVQAVDHLLKAAEHLEAAGLSEE